MVDQRSTDERLAALEGIVEQVRGDLASLSERLAQATQVEAILDRAHTRAACPQD